MPSLRARWCVVGVVALCLLIPAMLLAQGTGGRILGRIADPTGAVLSGVKITATNEATGVTHESSSNDSGDYVSPTSRLGPTRSPST